MPFHSSFLSFVLILLAAGAQAATLRVPGDFNTVQDAIGAADDGDTIRVGPGVGGGFDIEDRRDLRVIGEDGNAIAVRVTVSGSAAIELRNLVLDGDIVITDSTAVTVKRCNLSNGGIFVSGGSNVAIERNQIRKAPVAAIRVDDVTGFTVRKNVVRSPEDDGVIVSGSGAVKANRFEGDTQGTAILVAGTGGIEVMRNKISKIQGIGVEIDEGTEHQIIGNVITEIGADAIRCNQGVSNRVQGNRLKFVNDGLDFREGCDENELLGNRIKTAFADGIDVAGIGNRIIGNVVKGAFDLGIELDGTRNIVEDNTIKGALDQEIRDAGDGNFVRDNHCADNDGGECN